MVLLLILYFNTLNRLQMDKTDARFACGSKVLNDLFLLHFYPAGKNVGEKKEKYRCESALLGDGVTAVE